MKLSQISEVLDTRLENASPDTEITGVAGIEHAGPGQITFVANVKYAGAAKTTKASAVIVSENFPAISTGMLRSKNPYLAWAKAIELFYEGPRYAPGVHPTAAIHPTAKIGKNAHVGPYVVVDEDAEIGDNAVLLAHVVIYCGARIGNNFFAHAHAVVREFCELGDNVVLQNGVDRGLGRIRIRERRRRAIGTRSLSRGRPSLKATWNCRPTPASTAPASERRGFDAGRNSTTWCT